VGRGITVTYAHAASLLALPSHRARRVDRDGSSRRRPA
jgi:hypothetical protein